MARRAFYIRQHANDSDFNLLVDAGGYNQGRGEVSQIKTEYILRSMKELGYTAINVGRSDIVNGFKFLKEMEKKHKLPFISANLVTSEGQKPFFEPYIITKIKAAKGGGKLNVGIFGLTDVQRFPSDDDPDEPWLKCLDPVETAQRIVPELKKKADVIICLAYMPEIQAKKVLTQVADIQILISGGSYFTKEKADEINKSLFTSAVSRGKYCEILNVILDKNKTITNHNLVKITLDETIKDDPQILALVNESKIKLDELRKKYYPQNNPSN